MAIVYTSAKTPLRLGDELSRGGEGVVYHILEHPDLLAKIYIQTPHGGYEQKLSWMKSNPPDDPTRAQGHASLAWPTDLLYNEEGAFIGYVMPLIRDAAPILEVFNPYSRKSTYPEFTLKYLYRSARNFAAAVAALHARDYIIGDLNEQNVLVTSSALVTVIDTDSFQVREHRRERIVVYPCPVGKPEYMPPELQGWGLGNEVRRPEHDNFTLAVMIFQLLMEGSHPFRSRWLGQDDPPPVEKKIQLGYFPYDKAKQKWVAPPPNLPDLHILPPTLAAMFMRCFSEGLQDVRLRPSPAEWVRALQEAEEALNRCSEGHEYSGHLRACPYCSGKSGTTAERSFSLKQISSAILERSAQILGGIGNAVRDFLGLLNFGKLKKRYIALTAAALIIVAAGIVLIPYWQRSIAERALKLVSSIPIGYGQNRPITLPPIDDSQASDEQDKPNADEKDPKKDQSADQKKDGQDKDKKAEDNKKEDKNKTGEDNEKVKDKSGKDKNQKDKGSRNKDKESVSSTEKKPNEGNSSDRRTSKYFLPTNADQIVLLRSLLKDPHYAFVSLAYSPSGNLLAAGLSDYSVRLWRVRDGVNTLILRGHSRKVNSVAFSPDGSLIASGAGDLSVRIWKTSNGEQIALFTGHKGSVTSVAFSRDGQYLVSGSEDNTIRVWRLKDGINTLTINAHSMDVMCVKFAASDKIIVSGSKDNSIKFWRFEDGKLLNTINAHAGDVTSLELLPSGGMLVSGSMDYSVRFWSLRDMSLQRKLIGHQRGINSVTCSPNGELLASGSDDGTVKLWRVSTGELLRTLQNNVSAVKCLEFSPDGMTLSAGLENGTLNVWGISDKS